MASGDPPEASDSSNPSNPRELKLVSNPESPSVSTSALAPEGSSPSPSRSTPDSTPENSAATPSSERPATDEDGHDSSRRGLPIWLFVVLFLVSALAIGWQFRLAGQLEQQIAGLESELAATTALLGAHQSRLVEIRGGVRDLAVQIDGLKALVDAEPADSLSSSQPPHEGTPAPPHRAEAREIPARLPR
jgi:hypothetical protein